jgi:hypothetical protein
MANAVIVPDLGNDGASIIGTNILIITPSAASGSRVQRHQPTNVTQTKKLTLFFSAPQSSTYHVLKSSPLYFFLWLFFKIQASSAENLIQVFIYYTKSYSLAHHTLTTDKLRTTFPPLFINRLVNIPF